MFGYVRFSKPELKVKEYDTYHAVYCTLCKDMGKDYGLFTRFTLSYDFTFLAMLNLSLSDACPEYKKGRCTFNPLKKCNYCKNRDGFKMPSAAAVIMTYYKLLDNVCDNRGFKKLAFLLLKLLFSLPHKKAAGRYPEIEKIVSSYISEQSTLESENEKSLDIAAEPTAKALSMLLSLCSSDNTKKRVLQRLGYCIGRYIYLLDAACDFKKDKEHGNYNVFSFEYDTKEQVTERVKPQLYYCVNEAEKAFELLDLNRYKSILGNIIYLGLEETFLKELKQ